MGLVKLFSLVTSLAAICDSQFAGEWRDEYRDMILELHNAKRAEEGGCYMKAMKYDMGLEKQAKVWAERCVFGHEDIPGRGENIGMMSYKKDDWTIISTLYNMWHRENIYYKHGKSKRCGFACHYTQLIWANTDRVGCHFTKCPKWKFLVCFYLPGGNVDGQPPFTTNCTTPCYQGQILKKGLCFDAGDLSSIEEIDSQELADTI
jgi:hypothetical protein